MYKLLSSLGSVAIFEISLYFQFFVLFIVSLLSVTTPIGNINKFKHFFGQASVCLLHNSSIVVVSNKMSL